MEINHREGRKVAEGPVTDRGYLIKGDWLYHFKKAYNMRCAKLSVRVSRGCMERREAPGVWGGGGS